jgi:hypothetical protein
MMSGVGVEKIFPLYAPFIDKIEITRRSKVRRAKLYFIRDKVAREVRRQLRNMRLVSISTADFAEEEMPVVETPEIEEGATEEMNMTEEAPAEMEAVEVGDEPVSEEAPEVVEAIVDEVP